ncbi:MAG: glycerate kinase [Clostridia bacterium]|nr:glycerate kinase [Clostridia bacterium]
MKKIVVIPDSFKGTVSSMQFCRIAERAIKKSFPGCEVVSVPVADGGEGSVDAFLESCGGEKVKMSVTGPLGEKTESFFGVLPDGTAVVEMAAAAGLPLVGDRKDPSVTTTYGVGELMRGAIERGAKKLILALGGSATNDGAAGAAAALGAKFFDAGGKEFVPVGGTLKDIKTIDVSGLKKTLSGVEVRAMCDIDNPLCGPTGAAAVFGPQKGAGEDMVKMLDAGLYNLAGVIKKDLGEDVIDLPGAGAAGGMGAGAAAFFGAKLVMGIEAVLDTVGFDKIAADADLVISGEGKIDTQSLRGKVVIGIARRTKKLGVPLIAVVGDVGDGYEEAYSMGVSAVFSINRVAVPFSEARLRSERDLEAALGDIFRFAAAIKKK